MIWAIDLDDGTLINALGSNLSRPKAGVYNVTATESDRNIFGYGSGSDSVAAE